MSTRGLYLSSVLSLLAGCSQTPLAPTIESVATDLAIVLPADRLTTATLMSASALATLSDGTRSTVTPGWSVDQTDVAIISDAGQLLGVGAGIVTVVARYQGHVATAPLRVVPDFSGTWIGPATLRGCLGFADVRTCGRFMPTGTVATMRVLLTQSGDNVSGTIAIEFVFPPGSMTGVASRSAAGDVAGRVDARGVLGIGGALYEERFGALTLFSHVVGWKADWRAGRLDGEFSMAGPGRFGTVGEVRWAFTGLRRVSP